jgi:hypothetical protein
MSDRVGDELPTIEPTKPYAELYASAIAPRLIPLEAVRLAAHKTLSERIWFAPLGVLIGTIPGFVVYSIFREPMMGLIFGTVCGIIGLVAAIVWARDPLDRLRRSVKMEIIQAILAPLDAHHMLEFPYPPAFDKFKSCRLIPNHNESKFEDLITGAHSGCGFEMYEARLVKVTRTKNGTSRTTVFEGLLIRVAFPRDFLGQTLVLRDQGMFNWAENMGTRLDRIGLADPVFEKQFEVYGSDQVEARYLVDPSFMQRLLDTQSLFAAKNIRCAFEGGDLLVALERSGSFEPDDLSRPFSDPKTAESIYNEIMGIYGIIDQLLGRLALRAELTGGRTLT